MSLVNVSIILPTVSDKSKFARFCASLFTSQLNIEILVCQNLGQEVLSQISTDYADKIKIFTLEDKLTALNKAVETAQGKFLIFSDVSVTFSDNAIEKLIVASKGNAAACNVGLVNSGSCKKAYAENFSFDELAGKSFCFNHLLSIDVIKNNQLTPCGTDDFSLMLFIADYYRYDSCTVVNEVLVYSDSEREYSSSDSISFLSEYANVFKVTGNIPASMFFLRAVFSTLLKELSKDSFDVLKAVTSVFSDDYVLLAWLKAIFGVDSLMLCDENTRFEDFKYNGANIFYKEVTLPVTPESAIKNFYFGKFGIDVLKKCIGAWGYYKCYRQKDGIIKKYGCKFFGKLLGGDFDV